MKTSVNIKMEVEDRDAAKKLFDSLGLDMTTAVNLFVKASLREQAIPFPVAMEQADAMRERFERELEKDLSESEREIGEGKTVAHRSAMKEMRAKYGL